MTIDEAIKHCLEVAENYRYQRDDAADINDVRTASDCQKCADDHEQLAEWLSELKDAKRLLKAAVDGFIFLGAWMDDHEDCVMDCSDCPLHRPGFNCRGWKYTADVEKLIGEIDE